MMVYAGRSFRRRRFPLNSDRAKAASRAMAGGLGAALTFPRWLATSESHAGLARVGWRLGRRIRLMPGSLSRQIRVPQYRMPYPIVARLSKTAAKSAT